jgi:LysM repeat protein
MKFFVSRHTQVGLAIIVAILLIAAVSSSAAAASPTYHTVKWGQTLYSIAREYGVSVWAIACANGLHNPNYIYAGQTLVIPKDGWDSGCKPGHDGYDDHKGYGDQSGYGDHSGYGEEQSYGDHSGYGDQQSYDDHSGYGDQQGYGDHKDYGKDDGHGYPQDSYDHKNPCCEPKYGGENVKYDNKCCEQPKCCEKGWDDKKGGKDKGDEHGKNDKWDDHKNDDHAGYPYPKHFDCWYTVKWGDHLYRIALKYNLPWTVLAYANGLHNGNYIYAGQVLSVPCQKPVVY